MPADLLDKLDKTPTKRSVFLWADYMELRALVHPDRYFSLDGAEEALQEAQDYSADADDPDLTQSSDGLDKLAQRWNECEQTLERRQHLFGDAYPFTLAHDYRGLELRDDPDHLLRQWYRFLLLSSALQYVPNYNSLTSAFERAALSVFKLLTPVGAQAHGFWPGAHHYPNDKVGRLTKLAEDLRSPPVFANNAFHAGDKGDAGIDLVAWHPLGDMRDRMPIAIGQCGCSVEDWRTKPHSVARSSLNQKIAIGPDWWQFYFMPLDLHGPHGLWADGTGELPSVIVIDRARFISLAREHTLVLPVEAQPLLNRLDKHRFQ